VDNPRIWQMSHSDVIELAHVYIRTYRFSTSSVDVQGSMLWSQFSAIFANFRRKFWRFSQKPMLWWIPLQKLAVVWAKKRQIFCQICENVLKIVTSVPANPFVKQSCFAKLAQVRYTDRSSQNVVGPGLRFESRQKLLFSTRTVLSCLCWKPINHHFCNRWIHVTS
jgi:hypothetical protein